MRRSIFLLLLAFCVWSSMAIGTTTNAAADPRDFTLVNESDVTIMYVYVTSSDTASWNEDLLGNDVLIAGQSINITFAEFSDGNCLYDIKVVAADGREGYLWAIDLCTINTVTFS